MHRVGEVRGSGAKYVRLLPRAGIERIRGSLAYDEGAARLRAPIAGGNTTAEVAWDIPRAPLVSWGTRAAEGLTRAGAEAASSPLSVRAAARAFWLGRMCASGQVVGAKRTPPNRGSRKPQMPPGGPAEAPGPTKRRDRGRRPGEPEPPLPSPGTKDWERLPGEPQTPPPAEEGTKKKR